MRWFIMSGPQLLCNAYIMHINYGITLVMMNNAVCPTCLSSVLKATCLIACSIPHASMLETTKMVACPTFMSHYLMSLIKFGTST